MNLPATDEFNVAKQAAQWLEILKTGGPGERAAFAKWVKESHTHLREFLMMTALDRELHGIDRRRQHDIQVILAESASNVVTLKNSEVEAPSGMAVTRPGGFLGSRRRTGLLAAGVAAVAIACGWFVATHVAQRTYVTAIGEQRAIELEDGSIVHVNTKSRVEVNFSAAQREVRLVDGEALFKVAPDAARPFKVHVTGNTIQALGTQFNVYREHDRTTVAVLEGSVKISSSASQRAPTILTANQQAHIALDGSVAAQTTADIQQAAAWRQRRLMFRGSTLTEIVNEFNRYNRSPQLIIEDDALRTLEFTANFEADDPESLIDFLGNYNGIVCEARGNAVVIRQRIGAGR